MSNVDAPSEAGDEAERSAPHPFGRMPDEAERAAVMGQLSGGILHEFNNILTVISGTIDILAQVVVDRPEFSVITRLIDDAAVRGARLTAHLIDFERGNPPRLRAFDLGILTNDTARLLRPVLGAHTEFAVSAAAEPLPVLADPALLMAALLKLVMAARDSVSAGGRISIVAGGARAGAADEASGAASDAAVAIEIDVVSATGADGLPAWESRDLGTVEDLVRLSGGDFVVEPGIDGRAVFEIRLHRAPPETDD